MDEPFQGLDLMSTNYLQETIVNLQTEDINRCCIISDHAARDLLKISDRAVVLANKKIAALSIEEARLSAAEKYRADTKPKTPEEQDHLRYRETPSTLPREQAAKGTPDPKASAWADKNTWFGQDSAMTYTAFDLHKKLTEQEGFDPSSDEYYSEIDKRIRLEFPHKFANNSETAEKTTKPVQTVASAKRSTRSGRKTVRLTPSQVAIAKKLGVPLEEYAKQLNITKEA